MPSFKMSLVVVVVVVVREDAHLSVTHYSTAAWMRTALKRHPCDDPPSTSGDHYGSYTSLWKRGVGRFLVRNKVQRYFVD